MAGDEERYNKEIRPQNLPLREGICVLFKMPTYNPKGISRLNWHRDNPRDGTVSGWAPIPRPLIASRSMDRTNPNLDCLLYQSPGCLMICKTAETEALTTMSRTLSIHFQIQRSTNTNSAPHFPTIMEAEKLCHAFNNTASQQVNPRPLL